jgi:beta propeller repeat protein
MRRLVLVSLAAAALAACADSTAVPTAPGGPAAAERSAPGIAVSQPQVIAINEGGQLYAQNLPLPDIGGKTVVWQDASSGSTQVLSYDLASGKRAMLGTVSGTNAYPATDGRYSAWTGQDGTVYVHNANTGSTTTAGLGYGPQVSGDEVAFVDFSAGVGNAAVYDASAGTTRLVTHYTAESGEAVRGVDLDGKAVAFSTYTTHSPYTTGIAWADLRTGEVHEVVHVSSQAIGDPSVSGSRIVWADDRSGNYDVYLYDVRTGEQRQITTDPAGQFNAQISGSLIVWEDSRNSQSHYFPENDVYLFDLVTNTESPVAMGPDHAGWPRISGHYVLWTARTNDRWEVTLAEVRRGS